MIGNIYARATAFRVTGSSFSVKKLPLQLRPGNYTRPFMNNSATIWATETDHVDVPHVLFVRLLPHFILIDFDEMDYRLGQLVNVAY